MRARATEGTLGNSTAQKRLQLKVEGMCCADEAAQVERALKQLDGVLAVQASLVTGTVTIDYVPSARAYTAPLLTAVRKAVEGVGCSVPEPFDEGSGVVRPARYTLERFPRQVLTMLGLVFGAVLLVVVVGEWLGLLDIATERVPWPLGLAVVLAAGYPIFRNVLQAAWHKRITSHTLMTVGAVAAMIVGAWAAAAVVVFFMRVGDWVERFTTARARRSVQDLTAMAPLMARVERGGAEQDVPASEVRVGETVIVRPGEQIPVDGDVLGGQATVDQAAITGESMPAEVGPGGRVFAATIARLGGLRIRAAHVGAETTFGRAVTMVQEAEAHRAEVQRLADRFSGYYLPIVLTIAALTLLLRHDPLATAAVLVVACSCAFALATPVAMLASIGAGARRGLLIKGGKYLETLARADVLLIDKTGTLTLGRPHLTDVIALNGASDAEVLRLAASAERYSEHPVAEAVRAAARERKCRLEEPQEFEAIPGLGVRALVGGRTVAVGNRRMLPEAISVHGADDLEVQGKTLLFVAREGTLVGVLAAADTPRPEVPRALDAVRALGVHQIELLTGDHARAAAALAERLGVHYRANLLPEEKIGIVKAYQAKGHTVIMVGDGVNDAPALAQADVGIAMGAAGAAVAIDAAHLALMRDDWMLVPEALRLARRTMRVVQLNIAFTAVYNLVGLALAALGLLPLIVAAAAQSLPDLGILANSSRLLRQGKAGRSPFSSRQRLP